MANVVEIELRGKDASAAAFRLAADNMKRMQKDTAAAMQTASLFQGQLRGMGQTINNVGNVASLFGQQHLATAASGIATVAMASREATTAFNLMNGALKKSLIGLAALGATFAISKYLEAKDAALEAAEAQAKLGQMTEAAQLAQIKMTNAVEGARQAERMRHRDALQNIKDLAEKDVGAKAINDAVEEEEKLHNLNMEQIIKDAAEKEASIKIQALGDFYDFKKELEALERAGEVDAYVEMLNSQDGALYQSLQRRREAIQLYTQFWEESHRSVYSYIGEGTRTVMSGLSNSISEIALGGQKASKAFADLGKSVGKMFISWIVHRTLAFAVEKAFSAAGIGMAKAQATAIAPIAGGVASSWAGAATASLIATYGASASAAALLPVAAMANMAILKGLAVGGSQAHGGVDYVPQDQTVLLQQGERVIKRNQNEKLMEMLEGGGGGGGGGWSQPLIVQVGDQPLAKLLLTMSRDGRLTISERAIV